MLPLEQVSQQQVPGSALVSVWAWATVLVLQWGLVWAWVLVLALVLVSV